MSNKRRDLKEDVEEFIFELKEILTSSDFDVFSDLDILLKKASEDQLDPYTTGNTMVTLEFDKNDVRDQLLLIDVRDYVETIIDNKDSSLPPFRAFCRDIQDREVYIKVKIRDRVKGKVFCVSFHFARRPFIHPLPYEF